MIKRIDILYFGGCPNHKPAIELVEDTTRDLGVDFELVEVEVRSAEDAIRHRFLGSPSIRVNGVDIEPAARQRSDFGLACRTYGGRGLPPNRMLAVALCGKTVTLDSKRRDSPRR